MKSKFLPLFIVVCLAQTVRSATINWVGTTTGDWTTASNWSNSASPSAGNAYVVDGTGKTITSVSTGSATFAGDSLTVSNGSKLRLFTSTNGGGQTDTFTIPNLTLNAATISPASSNGTVTQSLANLATLANAVVVELNDTAGNSAFLTFNAGYTGSGSLTVQRSGTTGNGRGITINGTTSGYSGAVTTSGNSSSKGITATISAANGWGTGSLTIGQWSTVTLTADVTGTGATTVNANGTLQFGSASAAGSLAKDITDNGSVVFNRTAALTFGNVISGTGSVTQSGTGATTLAGSNSYSGGTTISGGTLSLANANAIGTTGTITMSGGTLQFTGSNNADYSSRLKLGDAVAATFDTGGRIVYFGSGLSVGSLGSGALTKTGLGILSLDGSNSYSGATTVTAGTLDLLGTLNSPITVASGATLSGSGFTFGSITLASGSNLLVGSGTLSGTGVIATSGVNLIPAASAVAVGANTLTVISYGAGNDPTTAAFSAASFRSPTLTDDTVSQLITLSFTAGTRTWSGTTGTWDLGTSTPWVEGDKLFFSGDAVTFPDIAADNVVTLTGTLAPSAVSVTNNAAFNYTFSGTGSITGTTALSKTGTGTLTMATANTYTGGTTINGGTLTAAAVNPLGIGPVAVTSGTLALNAGSLTNPINGSGTITALGTVNDTLSGDLSSFTGPVTVATTGAGKLVATAVATLPSSSTVTVNSGSTFFSTGAVVFTNTFNLQGTGNTENLGALRLDSGAKVAGNVVLGANSFVGSGAGVGTISGVISGGFSVTKQGTGTITLSGANTYTGATILAGGTLSLGSSTTLASTSAVTFGDAASVFDIGTFSPTIPSLGNSSITASRSDSVKGTGTLTLNGASDFVLQNPGGSATPSTLTVDMSALSNLVLSKSANSVILGGTGNARSGTITFADHTTVTVANFYLQSDSSGNATANTGTLNLGTATTLNSSNIVLLNGASARDNATLRFRSGVTNPTLTIRGTDGTSRASLKIGAANTVTNSAAQTGSIDLLTGVTGTSTLDALLSTLDIGDGRNNTTSTYSFAMGAGTLDTTTLIVGNKNNVPGTNTSTFSVTGGTVKASTVTLGIVASGGAGVNSTITLNGGATLAAQTITTGTGSGTRLFSWNDGTISNYDASTNLTVSSALKLAATGTHAISIGSGRTGTFSGIISEVAAGGSLTKAGDGTATLSGANTYTGDTLVTGGKLSISNAYLAAGADVRLSNGGVIDLTFAATDTIDELYIDGVQQLTGTWGSLASSATHKTARITGTGILQVTTGPAGYASWAATNAGGQAANLDFDNDGVANGVEYFMGATGSTFTPNPAVINGTITWPKDPTAAATGVVETSPDLVTWTSVTAADNGTSLSYTLPTGSPKLFVRLRVTTTP